MQRIAIIGNAGGGKSVLARRLGSEFSLPIYHFDDLQWRPGWMRMPEDEISIVHDGWLAGPIWIIDGWGSWVLLEERFAAADTIIFVDFPLPIHYWWAIKRQFKAVLKRQQGWPPEGCHALPVTGQLFKLIWQVHTRMRPQLVELISQYTDSTRLIHFRSSREMSIFLSTIKNGT